MLRRARELMNAVMYRGARLIFEHLVAAKCARRLPARPTYDENS